MQGAEIRIQKLSYLFCNSDDARTRAAPQQFRPVTESFFHLDQAPLEDDMKKLAMRTGWDVRVVRRIVDDVVATGRYERREGKLTNEHMQQEITKFVEKQKVKRAEEEARQARMRTGSDNNAGSMSDHRGDNDQTLTDDLPEN